MGEGHAHRRHRQSAALPIVSRSQTVTLAVTVWTTAVERFVLSSPGSRVGDKCEQYRKGHESHYLMAEVWGRVLHARRGRLCNVIHALCGIARTYRPPYILPGESRTKRSTEVVRLLLRA